MFLVIFTKGNHNFSSQLNATQDIEPSLEKDAKAIRRKFAGASLITSRSLNFLLASSTLLSLKMPLQEPVTCK